MKFIAVQTGARRGYAVPRILNEEGILERFYTDLAGNVGLGRWLTALAFARSGLARLAHRRIPTQLIPKTRTFGAIYFSGLVHEAFGAKTAESRFLRKMHLNQRWGSAMVKMGFGAATHVYSMLGEGGVYMAEAHRRGLTVVAEVYILLATEQLMKRERRAFPDWESHDQDYADLYERHVKEDVLMQRTHFYICPSQAVQEDLVANWGVERQRTSLVPYGMDPRWLQQDSIPQTGRVLFVGTADLRKGIHYLAMAAEKLHTRGRQYEFRVAGNVTDKVREQPICKHLNFLGRVPRDRIHQEFQKADVFVLPSLAEGSAEVTYEALAAALPLVVTKAAGSVARDGIDGRIVRERDVDELANALELVIENRPLRDRMAKSARERARDFTWEKYGERLIAALQGFSR